MLKLKLIQRCIQGVRVRVLRKMRYDPALPSSQALKKLVTKSAIKHKIVLRFCPKKNGPPAPPPPSLRDITKNLAPPAGFPTVCIYAFILA